MLNMEGDKLFYYSKSANKQAGKGVNEFVSNLNKYDELNKIKDWRKMLSNFYVSEFTYNDKTYYTAEHAFQAKKIEIVDANKANFFCIESGNIIGTTKDGNIARKNRKLVILDDENIKIWNEIKHNIMKEILICKFTQNNELGNVLLLTKNAILLHGAKGIPISRQYDLEEVRNYLQL
jgi:ribA/ribD-fused uncharacterized protein